MKRYLLPLIIMAAVAALTIGAGAMLLQSKRRAVANQGIIRMPTGKLELKPFHIRGSPGAPITIEEFGDFQCPACAVTSGMMRALEKDYGSRLRTIFWQFPLPIHRHGREAALAAEAASRQGRFWEMHDLLYQNQAAWSSVPEARKQFEKLGADLHLDAQRFRKDLDSPEVAARVDAEHEYGAARGVENTPTLFVNEQLLPPPFTPERIHQAIDAAISGEKSSNK